jgi:hypothetical protein
MSRSRVVLATFMSAGLIVAIPVLGLALKIRRAVAEACDRAKPLVASRAPKEEIIRVLGPETIQALDQSWGVRPDLLIFSTGEYILSVHLDSGGRATAVECTNQ